ncbi:MAG TPA: choice-of-anchor D domain-containing protein [Candidatus Binataceae bacterium]|nr:choice-of-anchor D domain-containing protein [Candidatus Binataceae bacterium]
MKPQSMIIAIAALILTAAASASATQYPYTDSGGSVSSTATELTITGATLGSPAGTVTISCPLVAYSPIYFPYSEEWTCIGGSLTAQSNDGTTSISGSFTTGRLTLQEFTSRGATTYDYVLYANFSGSQTIKGASTAVLGEVIETLAPLTTTLDLTSGTIQSGTIDINQQYEPIYVADTGNNRIVRMLDMLGSGWTTLGKAGSGINQFSAPWGIAVDSAGKIYVTDSTNCRIVRMDNISGKNWTSYGTCGAGTGQFSSPKGLWVDASGIYIADSGNNRVVFMSDLSGTNFTAFGSLGNGTNQFDDPSGVARDSAGKIYVADTINGRIVRVDDLTGTNWTTLSSIFPMYDELLAITLDAASRIYVTDDEFGISEVIRTDNITGANPVYVGLGNPNYLYYPYGSSAVFVDPDGAIYIPDTADRIMRFFDLTDNGILILGTYATPGTGVGMFSKPEGLFVVPSTRKGAVASVSPASLSFPTELVGSPSPAESATLSNIGTGPLTLTGVGTATADFPATNNCPTTLLAGQNCSASVVFQPVVGGLLKDSLSFTTAKSAVKVSVRGSGALVSLSPSYLVLYDGQSGVVTITNPLTTTAGITSIKATKPFFQVANTCGASLAPGASCSYTVGWNYTGYVVLGDVIVTDGSGTPQYVGITGE